MSYLDNGVNYCNMWNVISRLDGFSVADDAFKCATVPSNPATTCKRY